MRMSLVNAGILTPGELEEYSEVARKSKEALWEILLRQGKITESWLADTFSQRLRIPIVVLGAIAIDPEAVHRIPESLARLHHCIPYALEGRVLKVAFVDPSNLGSVQAVEFYTGSQVQPAVTLRSQVLEAIDRNYSRTQAVDIIDQAGDQPDIQIFPASQDVDLDENSSLRAAEIPPIIKLVNLVITEALRVKASDIHIEPSEHEICIRLRVDGVLRDFLQAPAWLHPGLSSRLKVLSKLDITEKRVPQDGRFKVRFQQKVTDMRLSTLPTQFGEKVVMRVLGSSEGIPQLEQLGIPVTEMPTILEAVRQPQGMIIVTGPTGSGKTTSLYSLLNYNRSREVNIVTIEDPIEYQLEGANQVQINPKAGLTFAACLRSILRQDPDTILVGEIRDRETVETAFHAAMTGHLVLTTLHTNNSIATVLRLLDLGVDPFVITSSVMLIVAQRLVRVVCDKCREVYTPAPRVLERLGWEEPGFAFTHGRGCQACHGTGFKGRIGIYEILRMTLPVREAINERGSEVTIRKAAVQSGMVPLLQAAREKIRQGVSTPEEVIRSIQLMEEESASCPRCGRSLSGEAGKCLHCESTHTLRCLTCGQAMESEWQVCPHCSTPAAHMESRSATGLKWDVHQLKLAQKKAGTVQ
jgi:type IV pilus assembly protein PilB